MTSLQESHPDDDDVQDVPEAEEVADPVGLDFQHLLDDVVEDEDAEHELARHERVVAGVGVLQQLDGRVLLPGEDASGGGKFKIEPEN